MITKQNALEVAERLKDFAEGKLEYQYDENAWRIYDHDTAPGDLATEPHCYRRKPEPKLRPWRWDEVPVGAVFRATHSPQRIGVIAGSDSSEKVTIFGFGINSLDIVSSGQWRYAHETEWKPCGVEEA